MGTLRHTVRALKFKPTDDPRDIISKFMDYCKEIGGEILAYNTGSPGDEFFAVCAVHNGNKLSTMTLTVDPMTSLAIARAKIEDDKTGADTIASISSFKEMECRFVDEATGINPADHDGDVEPSVSKVSRMIVCRVPDEEVTVGVNYRFDEDSRSYTYVDYRNLRTKAWTDSVFDL